MQPCLFLCGGWPVESLHSGQLEQEAPQQQLTITVGSKSETQVGTILIIRSICGAEMSNLFLPFPPRRPAPATPLRFSGEEIKFLIRHPNTRLAKRSLLPIKCKERKKKKKSVLSIYKIGPLGFHPPTQLKVLMMRSVTAPAASQPPPELTFSVEASSHRNSPASKSHSSF